MTAVVSNSAPARTPIALACAVSLSLFAGAALAAADVPDAAAESVSTVHVTGARFASDPALTPIGATVITADEIRNAGVTDVNAAIRKIGGVYGRQSFDGSPDFALDLRGFGTNSSQNMVVMVDGVRMNENELTGAVLSTIPVDTVERIEIMRGGSSVLYGEGATGGVINIITKRGADGGYHGSLALEAGQRHSFDTRASVRHGAGPLSFDLAAARRAAITTAPTTSSCKRPSAAASSGRRMARAWGCAPKARARMRVSRCAHPPGVRAGPDPDPYAARLRRPRNRPGHRLCRAAHRQRGTGGRAVASRARSQFALRVPDRVRSHGAGVDRLHPPDPVLAAPAPDRPLRHPAQRSRRRHRPDPLGARRRRRGRNQHPGCARRLPARRATPRGCAEGAPGAGRAPREVREGGHAWL
ncbi:TonB-dependent receptor plug domain-containing protein [Massilia sp. Se16.2.3]|nr:TonB-dependent receptor plug domain-containing protein [Massilia sp. Se16.2.3]